MAKKKKHVSQTAPDRATIGLAVDGESDRGLVLIAAEVISGRLESMIRTKLKPESRKSRESVEALFSGGTAPLSTFSNRTELAFALGLIDDELYESINLVREIRNEFAHHIGVAELQDATVLKLLDSLEREVKKLAAGPLKSPWGRAPKNAQFRRHSPYRLAFELCATMIVNVMDASLSASSTEA